MTEHVEQPLPVPSGEEYVHDRVAKALLARKEIGIQRYKTGLQPFNGRDALRDAHEEILDLSVYFQQLIDEQSPITPLVNAAWHVLEDGAHKEGALEPLVQLYGQLTYREQIQQARLMPLLDRVAVLNGPRSAKEK